MSYSDVVLADSPALYWKLNEASGSAVDSSGHGITGTYVSTTLNQTAILNRDCEPDAASITWPTSAGSITSTGVDTSNTDFSIEIWLKPSSLALAVVVGGQFHGYNMGLADASGHVELGIQNVDNSTASTGTVSTTKSNHVVATYTNSSSALQFWINGVAAGNSTYSTAPDAGTKTATVMNDATFPYSGTLEALAIYTSVLTQARVEKHYAAGTIAPGIRSFKAIPVQAQGRNL